MVIKPITTAEFEDWQRQTDATANRWEDVEFTDMAREAMPRLLARVKHLESKWESKCKCGNLKAQCYEQCESCYEDGR